MKPSVLIVDDEKVICDGLSRLLSDSYETYTASNAREAIDIVHANENIDVMLCDLMMPEMDGNEMIEAIRSDNKDISMIVMTAHADPVRVCDAMKKGANHFLLKPLNISQLETSIRNAVNRKTLNRQTAIYN